MVYLLPFLSERLKGISRYWDRLSLVRPFVRSTRNQLLQYLENRLTIITKFYTDIHTDIVYSYTGYDAITYFRSEVIWKNSRKYCLRRLLAEFSENGSS